MPVNSASDAWRRRLHFRARFFELDPFTFFFPLPCRGKAICPSSVSAILTSQCLRLAGPLKTLVQFLRIDSMLPANLRFTPRLELLQSKAIHVWIWRHALPLHRTTPALMTLPYTVHAASVVTGFKADVKRRASARSPAAFSAKFPRVAQVVW